MNFLTGYKTYLIGSLMVILGALQGDQNLILQGFAVITTRKAISNK